MLYQWKQQLAQALCHQTPDLVRNRGNLRDLGRGPRYPSRTLSMLITSIGNFVENEGRSSFHRIIGKDVEDQAMCEI
jgi:hypothetical protein